MTGLGTVACSPQHRFSVIEQKGTKSTARRPVHAFYAPVPLAAVYRSPVFICLSFYPPLAGVAFGRNPFRWTQRIRREDGLARLVFGLGTRAVERTDDYTRLVALSHPLLRPEADAGD